MPKADNVSPIRRCDLKSGVEPKFAWSDASRGKPSHVMPYADMRDSSQKELCRGEKTPKCTKSKVSKESSEHVIP